MELPIDPELLKKRMLIPVKLAELSYVDQETAIHYLRVWGEKKMPVTELFKILVDTLGNNSQ